MPATSTDALLLIDKPEGMSSHDVVALARRALATRRIGHSGTLDPFATGLLVLLAGRGTRLLRFVPGEPKEYEADITFGLETDSDDRTGAPGRTAPPPTAAQIHAVLPRLTGWIEQRPPAFSAKHVAGQRAYVLARRGELVDLPPVPVEVHGWEVIAFDGALLRARITCGGGTYIRALARDLGRLTGSAAHLSALRRTRVGSFALADADTVEALRAGTSRSRPLIDAFAGWTRECLDDDDARRASHGMMVAATVPGEQALLLEPGGSILAVAARQGEAWHPEVVLGSG